MVAAILVLKSVSMAHRWHFHNKLSKLDKQEVYLSRRGTDISIRKVEVLADSIDS